LKDMADDVIGLMDALRIHQAHIMGNSLGGMIVQTVAAHYPERLLSLTSIMSSSGAPNLPPATPEAMAGLMARAATDEREDVIQTNLVSNRSYNSPGFPDPVELLYEREAAAFDRCYCPDGASRQTAAVIAAGDRSDDLKSIKVRALIIHGVEDKLIPVEHGKDCAAKISGARLELIDGMGHDLPLALTARLTGLIADHALGKSAT
jgi:pimeloyl-ACP methyl ester carboxylesterase